MGLDVSRNRLSVQRDLDGLFHCGRNSHFFKRVIRDGTQGAIDRFSSNRQVHQACADGIKHRVGDGRRHNECSGFTDAFGAEWALRLLAIDRIVDDFWDIENAWNLVIGEGCVSDLTRVEMNLLECRSA